MKRKNSSRHVKRFVSDVFRELRRRQKATRNRRKLLVEHLEERALLSASCSTLGSGGIYCQGAQGGTSQTVPLLADLNLVSFRWENFSIPDEFQILQTGRRIVGDVGLQSGGNSGKTLVTARSPGGQQTSDQLQVKVTAPREGTAWNFDVSSTPVELIAEAKLGDVTGISLDELFNKAATGTTLASLGFDLSSLEFASTSNTKGKVAEVDDWQSLLKSKGVFYFVPTVTGTPLEYGTANRTDPGMGESQLFVRGRVNPLFSTDGPRQVEFPIKIIVTDGFSTSFSDPGLMQTVPAVDGAGKTKLDIYRQEQRLAYLGFPREAGTSLSVDGVIAGGETDWAQNLFSIAIDPALTRGQLPNPANGTKYFKEFINDSNSPYWRDLRGIPGLAFPASINEYQRFYGSDNAGRMISQANQVSLISSGAARKTGKGTPSKSHDGGRGFDLIPWFGSGQYYFDEVATQSGTRLVAANAAAGGGFVYKNASETWQGGGQLNNQLHVERGLRVTELVMDTSSARTEELRDLLKYRQEETVVQALLDSFISAGSPRIFYNDPRFFTTNGVIRYNTSGAYNHFNHIHFVVPGGVGTSTQTFQRINDASAEASGVVSSLTAARLDAAVPLGQINGTVRQSGLLNAPNREIIYQFQVGGEIDDDAVFPNLPRNLTVLLSGLSEDVDIELLTDPFGDGFGVIYAASSSTDTSVESLTESDLSSGIYYLRIFSKGIDTAFNLDLTVPPLPIPFDAAGSDLATALDFGDISDQTRTLMDFVGEVDGDDYFRFTLTSISDVAISISGLEQGDVEVVLGRNLSQTDIGRVYIATSDEEGNATEFIEEKLLPVGDYFIRLSRVSGNTHYQIRIASTIAAVPIDKAGNVIENSFDLGSLTSTINSSDFVGSIDPIDIYKFSVSSLVGVRIELTGLEADADIELFRDINGDGQLTRDERLASSVLAGTEDEVMTMLGLLPGTYFIRVAPYEGDTNYDLTVTPLAASGVNLVLTRSDSMPDVDLGDQFTYLVTVTNNGPDAATNVRLTETLPSGFQRIRVTRSGAASTIQNTATGFVGVIPRLEPGQTATFEVTVRTFIAGRLLMRSFVTSDTPDFDITSNQLNDLKTINSITSPPADLELSKSVDNLAPSVGERVTIQVSITNRGPGTATDIKVRSTLPDGLEFVSANPGPGASFDQATGIWNVGNMPVNATVLLTIVSEVRSNQPLKVVSEVIEVAEADPDSTPGNSNPAEDDYAEITIARRGDSVISGTKFNDLNGNGIRDRGLVLGSEPDVVFVIDVSGSTADPFGGTTVGDLNNDGDSNRILDAEIAGFIALNRDLVNKGLGQIADVSIVAFSGSASGVDLDPTTPGIQTTTKAGADKNNNGTLDVEEALRGLGYGGSTNFEAALREATALLQSLGTSPENGNVVFLSDGVPNSAGAHTDEVAQLKTIANNVRAFGVGTGASLPQLQIIDTRAVRFTTTDELLSAFQGVGAGSGSTEVFTEPGLAGVTIYIDLNNNGQLDAGEPTTLTRQDDPTTTTVDELGTYQFTQLAAGTYTVREVVLSGFQQTLPGGASRAYTITLAANTASTGNDFGNTASAATNSISGHVYADVDNNGIRFVTIGGTQVPQTGLPNVKIELVNTVTGAVLETRTNADGFYQFTAIADGTYLLRETQPIIFVDGIDTPGTPGLAALGGTLANDAFENLRLQGGVAATEYNFGERGLKAPYVTKSLLLASTPNSTTLAAQYDTNARFKITATSAGVLTIAGIPQGATAQLFTLDNQPLAPMEASGTAQYRVGEGESVYLVIENAAGTPTPSLLQVSIEPSEAYEAYYAGMHTNAFLAPDVNGDGWVTPIDALLIINRLNSMGTGSLRASVSDFVDVNRDDYLSPIDALIVINYLNRLSMTQGDGEAKPSSTSNHHLRAVDQYFSDLIPEGDDLSQKRRRRLP